MRAGWGGQGGGEGFRGGPEGKRGHRATMGYNGITVGQTGAGKDGE